MQPIVNGLQEEFDTQVAFVSVNAGDGSAGQAAFRAVNLPGHPGIILFDASGKETYRAFGVVTEDDLRAALDEVTGGT